MSQDCVPVHVLQFAMSSHVQYKVIENMCIFVLLVTQQKHILLNTFFAKYFLRQLFCLGFDFATVLLIAKSGLKPFCWKIIELKAYSFLLF